MKKLFLISSIFFIFSLSCQKGEEKIEQEKKYVSIAQAKYEDVEERIEVVGTLKPKFEVSIQAEFPAIVEEVYVTEWIKVKKGTPLAKLDTKELLVQLETQKALVEESEASFQRAKREYERAQKLFSSGLATKQNLEDSLSFLNSQEAILKANKAQQSLIETKIDKATIKSPIDGFVSQRMVSRGDFVGKDPIFKIVDLKVLDLTINIPSNYLYDIKLGQKIKFKTDSLPDELFEGNISFINPALDPISMTAKVIAEVENPNNKLKAGLFVKGYIQKKEAYKAILVPRIALLNWDLEKKEGSIFVYNDGKAHLKKIKILSALGDKFIVEEGLKEGDKFITDGAFLLKDGESIIAK